MTAIERLYEIIENKDKRGLPIWIYEQMNQFMIVEKQDIILAYESGRQDKMDNINKNGVDYFLEKSSSNNN